MPIRVPEGPVDPYDPFPLDGPSPSWNAAPIIRGRDVGFSTEPDVIRDSSDAQFTEFVDEMPTEARAPFVIDGQAEEAVDVARRSWPEVRLDPIGDGHDGWAVVEPAAPTSPAPAAEVADPWLVVGSNETPSGETNAVPETPERLGTVVSHHGGPPLSSRAILVIGALALLCLALAAALAFQALGDEPPALDARTTQAPVPGIEASTVPPRAIREALPVSDTTLTGIERAAMGPLEGELARLSDALQSAFGRSSAEVAPVLQPYVAHAAGRMRTHPARFILVVTAPDPELAAARADGILRAFQGAGLTADMLRMTAGAGPPSVRFER